MEVVAVSSPFKLLPPAPGNCPFCAVKHSRDMAHNAQSLYYAFRFRMEHGRDATWADAVAHCSPRLREIWQSELQKKDAWTEPAEGVEPIAEQWS